MSYDAIIIGSGAGGSAAAYRLVKGGKRVLLIEKGLPLPVDGSTLDIKQVLGLGVFKSREQWLDKNNRFFVPEEYFNLGGKTKWYGAALLRFDRTEFAPEEELKCLGWPIIYDDIAPYYAEAERLLGVRCFGIEPDLVAIRDRIARLDSGWRTIPLPLALSPDILTEAHEARHFDGFASAGGFKADAQNTLLSQILDQNNFTLITGQAVMKLVADPADARRIAGVLLEDGRRFTADTSLLAAGAMHSPRLLQAYLEDHALTDQLPCAGLIGRHFKRHLLTAMLALSGSRKTDAIRKTTIWLNDRYPHGSIQPLGFGDDVLMALMPRAVPRTLAYRLAKHAYGFFLQTEDGSDPANRILSVAKDAETRQPKLDYDPERFPELAKEHKNMINNFRNVLIRAGYISFTQSIPLAGTAHACGTLVAGRDPELSVVDPHGKVHGLDNLYVVDGSILPRSSRVNPALTIYAWALRTADYLATCHHTQDHLQENNHDLQQNPSRTTAA
ncbi:MAG: GMC oxidoreductase [Methylomicrobium sp.]